MAGSRVQDTHYGIHATQTVEDPPAQAALTFVRDRTRARASGLECKFGGLRVQ